MKSLDFGTPKEVISIIIIVILIFLVQQSYIKEDPKTDDIVSFSFIFLDKNNDPMVDLKVSFCDNQFVTDPNGHIVVLCKKNFKLRHVVSICPTSEKYKFDNKKLIVFFKERPDIHQSDRAGDDPDTCIHVDIDMQTEAVVFTYRQNGIDKLCLDDVRIIQKQTSNPKTGELLHSLLQN